MPLSPGITTSIRTTSGFVLERLEDRPLGVRRLADDLDVVLRVEQQPQAGADDRMVVDDEHADRSSQRHLGDERRARSRRRLDREPAAEQRDALAHPDEAEPVRRAALGSKPPPSSSTTAATDASRRVRTMLTAWRRACLTMFVSASWTIR